MLELLEIQNLNFKVMHIHIRHKNNRSSYKMDGHLLEEVTDERSGN